MKIAINNICIVPPLTGIGHFTLQLQLALQSLENLELICFKSIEPTSENSKNVKHLTITQKKEKKVLKRKVVDFLMHFRFFRCLQMVKGICLHKISFYKFFLRCEKIGVNVYLEPNYFIHFNYQPVVPIIYDLSMIRFPEMHTKERLKLFKKKLNKAIYQSNAIITISEFSKNEILDIFKINPNKIFVAPCGASSDFKLRNEAEVQKTLDLLNLKYRQFILVIGTFEPRKNLKNICEAYSQLSQELRQHYPLILCGAKGWGNIDLSKNTLELIEKKEIRILDYVSDSTLHELTSSARVSCYISFYEGFGLPVLEAMQSGTPVITSNVSSMPEVAGDAGILVSPTNICEIQTAMENILSDDELMQTMIDKGLHQAQKFSWNKCAKTVLSACEFAEKNLV